jgi:putative ABC transport system permease protein
LAATRIRSLPDRDEIDVARIDLEATATAAPAPAAKTPARRRGNAVRKRTGTWVLALRDLQWRRRRFGIAIAGTALVFAMTLLLSGLATSFRAEATRTIDALEADAWVVREGISGPFTAMSTIPSEAWRAVLESPTVQAASPLLVMHQSVSSPVSEDVNLFGYRLQGLGEPHLVAGRLPKTGGEVVVDRTLAIAIGKPVAIANQPFRVVGLTEGMTFNAGASNIYMAIGDAQKLAFEGRPVANAVLVRGTPLSVPKGLALLSNDAVRDDLLRPVENAVAAIDMVNFLLWIVAINIIGAVVYLSALERVRDFAVLKATGYSTKSLLAGLCLQAVLVSVGAVALALGISRILARYFPLPVVIPGRAMLILPAVGIAVGLLSSLFGMRRAGSVDPALAFGGP